MLRFFDDLTKKEKLFFLAVEQELQLKPDST